jgi:hypothetical protein
MYMEATIVNGTTMLNKDNLRAMEELAQSVGLPVEVVVDNIVTDYRAKRAAEIIEGLTERVLLAFSKDGETGEPITGRALYDFLLATYRMRQQQAR